MKITKLLGAGALVAATVLTTGVLPTQAAPSHHPAYHHPMSVNARQNRQQRRIVRGVRSDALTARETARLERREASINRQERRDRRDGGKFTAAERLRIQREQNRTSRAIYRQKHDSQSR